MTFRCTLNFKYTNVSELLKFSFKPTNKINPNLSLQMSSNSNTDKRKTLHSIYQPKCTAKISHLHAKTCLFGGESLTFDVEGWVRRSNLSLIVSPLRALFGAKFSGRSHRDKLMMILFGVFWYQNILQICTCLTAQTYGFKGENRRVEHRNDKLLPEFVSVCACVRYMYGYLLRARISYICSKLNYK